MGSPFLISVNKMGHAFANSYKFKQLYDLGFVLTRDGAGME
jgi:hypothetical protein